MDRAGMFTNRELKRVYEEFTCNNRSCMVDFVRVYVNK